MTPEQTNLNNLQSQFLQHKHTNSDGTKSFPFTNLSDVPTSYKGKSGYVAAVNPSESGLVFIEGGGIGDMQSSVYDPAGIDQQLVGITASQTLTNKTISGSSNSLSNIGNASLTNDAITIGSTSVALGATASTIIGATFTANLPTVNSVTASSGTQNLNLSLGNVQWFTFSGTSASDSVTFTTSNVGASQIFIVSITQNSGGSGTVTWFGTIRWAGGVTPTLTTTARARDTFGFICPPSMSGEYDGFIIGQNI